jgi:phosphate transport system substrate-binding protein
MKRFSFVALVLALLLAACGANPTTLAPTSGAPTNTTSAATSDGSTQQAVSTTDGVVSISGAFALYPLMQKWSQEYTGINSGTLFDIQAGGAGKGMTDVLAGAVNIAMVSRELRKEELDRGAQGFPVAVDAIVFTINAENPVAQQIASKGISKTALARLYIKQETLTWGELVGTDDRTPINVYTRADASGAGEQAALYLGGKSQDDLGGIAVQGDPGVLQAVSKDPDGLGYNNIGFAFDQTSGSVIAGITIVPLDQDENGTLDSAESFYADQKTLSVAIATKQYPSPPARELYLVTKGIPTGASRELIRWVLTEGQTFVESAGYVKVSPDKLNAALESIK